jgi:hypothetical protein
MAAEFSKRTSDGQNIWTCTTWGEQIVNQTKPMSHACRNHDRPRNQFQHPPPSFTPNTPPPNIQWDQMMRYQNEQCRQMMQFVQQQQEQFHHLHQQEMLKHQKEKQEQMKLQKDQMQIQQKQNSANLNRMMEMMKLQKANESKAKCPKWEKEENVKKVLNRLENWDDVEKG